jgi:outer membrane protein OmpA-like peptidoglycan-associated protein
MQPMFELSRRRRAPIALPPLLGLCLAAATPAAAQVVISTQGRGDVTVNSDVLDALGPPLVPLLRDPSIAPSGPASPPALGPGGVPKSRIYALPPVAGAPARPSSVSPSSAGPAPVSGLAQSARPAPSPTPTAAPVASVPPPSYVPAPAGLASAPPRSAVASVAPAPPPPAAPVVAAPPPAPVAPAVASAAPAPLPPSPPERQAPRVAPASAPPPPPALDTPAPVQTTARAPAPSAPAALPPSTTVASAAAPPAARSSDALGSTQATMVPGVLSRVLFAPGSADLSDAGRRELGHLAEKIGREGESRIQLLAYADGSPESESQARRLSLSRALAVRSFLIDQGVRSTRVNVQALGIRSTGGPADRVDAMAVAP